MKICSVCGSTCKEVGGGTYRCLACGNEYKDAPPPAPTKVIEKVVEHVVHDVVHNEDKGVEIFDKNINGVLEVRTESGCGSGYLIGRNGYAVTNAHVVALPSGKSCRVCSVFVAGTWAEARVAAMGTEETRAHCSDKDLALLQLTCVPSKATPLRFADANALRTGERIYVIGNSLGRGTCITSGIVSDKDRNGRILHDCPVNPGNSGGPVFNANGQVIGTHVANAVDGTNSRPQGMNYAIPTAAVLAFLRNRGIRV